MCILLICTYYAKWVCKNRVKCWGWWLFHCIVSSAYVKYIALYIYYLHAPLFFWFVCFLGLSSSRKYLSAYFHSAGRKHFLPFLSHFSSLVWLSQSLLFTFTHGNGKFSRSFLSKPVSSLLMSLWFLIMILDT